jgi:hypothetical protein
MIIPDSRCLQPRTGLIVGFGIAQSLSQFFYFNSLRPYLCAPDLVSEWTVIYMNLIT